MGRKTLQSDHEESSSSVAAGKVEKGRAIDLNWSGSRLSKLAVYRGLEPRLVWASWVERRKVHPDSGNQQMESLVGRRWSRFERSSLPCGTQSVIHDRRWSNSVYRLLESLINECLELFASHWFHHGIIRIIRNYINLHKWNIKFKGHLCNGYFNKYLSLR